jgi:Sulfotransferase domain
MKKWIYGAGCPKGNEDVYIARYQRHNSEVIEYFKDRGSDLLLLDITAGEGWAKLCPFLGERVPALDFPCANTAPEREKFGKRNSNYLWQMYLKLQRRVKRLTAGSLIV